MLLISDCKILSSKISKLKKLGKKICFIPTMGNLHAGHLKLIREGKKENQVTLLSIFVNPLQFDDSSDYQNYPRTFEQDKKLASKEDVDFLFMPEENFILKKKVSFELGDISKKLCGNQRKGHFQGVAAVIIEFLDLIKPNIIFLGEKDFQQIIVIKKIIKDLNYNTKVKIVSTVRDKDNVALSSRNKLLGKNAVLSVLIPKTLIQITSEIKFGNFKSSRIEELKNDLINKGIKRVDYLEILKEKDLNFPDNQFSKCRIFISVRIGSVKLIDNMKLDRRIRYEDGKLIEEKLV